MPTPPACTSLGRDCREIKVTVRISDLEDDSNTLQDAAATWMTGHTERITWDEPYIDSGMLMVDATMHVPCAFLRFDATGARCAAHGFTGRTPKTSQPTERRALQLGGDRFSIIHRRKRRAVPLPMETPDPRSLPVLQGDNPCLDAPCRTADNSRGAACCRDLQLELDVPTRQRRLEALIRSRKSPYLCKVNREDEDTIECEVISACGYLDGADGLSCSLHGRVRANGRPAKPSICSDWPEELDDDETGHPGCVFC